MTVAEMQPNTETRTDSDISFEPNGPNSRPAAASPMVSVEIMSPTGMAYT